MLKNHSLTADVLTPLNNQSQEVFQKPHKKLCSGNNLELVVDNGAQPTADTEFASPLIFFILPTDSVCDLKPSPLPSSPFLPFHCGYRENG